MSITVATTLIGHKRPLSVLSSTVSISWILLSESSRYFVLNSAKCFSDVIFPVSVIWTLLHIMFNGAYGKAQNCNEMKIESGDWKQTGNRNGSVTLSPSKPIGIDMASVWGQAYRPEGESWDARPDNCSTGRLGVGSHTGVSWSNHESWKVCNATGR